ncbi:thioesterase domain-containing protein [Streptomyces sp. NPDC003032]
MTALAQPVLTPFERRPGGLNTVVFHPAGGGLGQYVTPLSRLSRRGPVHGVRAMGLIPGEEPDRTVDAMAERYVGLIRDLPDRSDLLVGWSLGGLLAWEAAARLSMDGPAPAVVMIDSFAEPWSAYGRPRERLLDDIRRGALPDPVGLWVPKAFVVLAPDWLDWDGAARALLDFAATRTAAGEGRQGGRDRRTAADDGVGQGAACRVAGVQDARRTGGALPARLTPPSWGPAAMSAAGP